MHLQDNEIAILQNMIVENHELFVSTSNELKMTPYFKADIHTNDAVPVKQRPYPVSPKQKNWGF